MRACQAGHRVLFATAAEWVARLAEANHAGRIHAELTRLGRYPLLVVDEVGYIRFEPEANLFFQLVSSPTNGPASSSPPIKPPVNRTLFARTCA
jgi:DNA replication protein DnaC